MELTTSLPLYSLLVLLVAAMRLFELRVSRGRRADLAALGASEVRDPRFRIMVLFHTGMLVACGTEAWLARRPFVPSIGYPMIGLVVGATLLRWWVISSMGRHWNVQIMNSLGLGVVSDGPFRWVRHPNYVAVFVELLALPLVHGAYLTAIVGTPIHLWILHHRIQTEEAVLLADPTYRRLMGDKPRFLPLRGRAAR